MLNRAGFGGTQAVIAATLEGSPEQAVDSLLSEHDAWTRFEPDYGAWLTSDGALRLNLPRDIALTEIRRLRAMDGLQFLIYGDQWFRSMQRHSDPVRDRMTLFWHGFFTTSFEVIRRTFELVIQHQMLRHHASSSYAAILREIVRDPGMLLYLDNDTNVREHPNENLARELMELYSLGRGHFTEQDVREVARALTGYGYNGFGGFLFMPEEHDYGSKTVLGQTGNFDAEDVVEVILSQPQCARWIASRLITWFEGEQPEPQRLESYSSLLLEGDYELRPFLRTLFLDPQFYREEIIGVRVQAPIEWMVAIARKLEIEPPDGFVYRAAAAVGQTFYSPPTVAGWSEGESWITGETLMNRSNCVGALLGTFELETDEESMASESIPNREELLATAQQMETMVFPRGWRAETLFVERLKVARTSSDDDIVKWMMSELLAVEPYEDSTQLVLAFLRSERKTREHGPESLLDHPEAELVLRRTAHMILSLPEAQLG